MHCPQLFASWFKLQTSILETFCASERKLLVLRMPPPPRDKASDGAKDAIMEAAVSKSAAVPDGAKAKSAAVAAPKPQGKTYAARIGDPLQPGVLAKTHPYLETFAPESPADGKWLPEESHVKQMMEYINETQTEDLRWKKWPSLSLSCGTNQLPKK